jgi:hypothetical protein
MDRNRFQVIQGGRSAPPTPEGAVDLLRVPRDRWRRTIELRRGDETVAALHREGRTGYRAAAEIPPDSWTFDRSGLLESTVVIRSDKDAVGIFQDGELWLGDRLFRWSPGRWVDHDGCLLVRDRGDRVRIESHGRSLAEALLLALLAEYLRQVDVEP